MSDDKTKICKTHYEAASPSTLCLGCGHDQISKQIIRACTELQIDPFNIAKISGIGCSSKTPNYFLQSSRGFNTIHGRMACVATGVKIANKKLKLIGISGDGDTGSIGLSSFLHSIRKNIPMLYILENNGVYGLTKGQFSPTAYRDTSLKHKEKNPFYSINLCQLALNMGCGFIARAFSGDGKQLNTLLKLALNYEGFAFIDIISPCVAYGNMQEFPHSFYFMKKKQWPLHELDMIFEQAPQELNIKQGDVQKIPLANKTHVILKKLSNTQHDPLQKDQASRILEDSYNKDKIITGLIYYKKQNHFLQNKDLDTRPLVHIPEKETRLSQQDLQNILKQYR